jgi:hypothetical protein
VGEQEWNVSYLQEGAEGVSGVKITQNIMRNYSMTHIFTYCICILLIFQTLVHPVSAADPAPELPVVWKFPINGDIYGVSISDDVKYIAVGSQNSNIYLLNREGTLLWKYSTKGSVTDVAISADGQYIAAISDKLYLFNSRGTLLWSDPKYSNNKISMSADNQYIAISGGGKKQVYLVNRNGELLWTNEILDYVSRVTISKTGNSILVKDIYYIYRFAPNGTLLWKTPGPAQVLSYSLSSDGQNLVAVLWTDKDTGNRLYLFDQWGNVVWKKTDLDYNLVAISDNGQYIAAGDFNGRKLNYFSRDGTLLWDNTVSDIWYSISSDGSYVIGQINHSGSLFYQTGEVVGITKYRTNSNTRLSADGQYIVETAENSVILLENPDFISRSISRSQSKINLTINYNPIAAKIELDRAKSLFAAGNYDDALASAQKAYALAADVDQDNISNDKDFAPTIHNTLIYSIIAAIIICLIAFVLFDFRRCRVHPKLSLSVPDVHEGEMAVARIAIGIDRKFREISCPLTLDGKPGKAVTSPGAQEIPLGILPLGTHTAKIDCTIKQIRYGRRATSTSTSFEVKPAVPEINVNVDPCECYEGETADVSVTLTNNTPFGAIFPEFRLDEGQSRTLHFTLAAPEPGILEKTESLSYNNIVGRTFSLDIPLWCKVMEVVPTVELSTDAISCPEGELPVARIAVRNSSVHDAIFETFTLAPQETRTIDLELPRGTIGKNTMPYTLKFRNRRGILFEKQIVLEYSIIPVEPEISVSTDPLRCLEGDPASAILSLTNTSEFEAVFNDYSLKPKESKTLEIPADTRKPGEQQLVFLLDFKNIPGRSFTREIPIQYIVEAREPKLDAVVTPVPECYEGDTLAETITIRNDSPHEAVFDRFTLRNGESQKIEVHLNTSRTGVNTVTYSLEYKNRVGRSFNDDITINYSILPLPRPSVILTSDIMEGSEGVIRIEVTNSSGKILERFKIVLETPEDLRVKENSVEMKQIGPGERRSISFKVFATFGGDYAVRATYSYSVAGRMFENQLPATVHVASPMISSQIPPAPSTISPAEAKAAKARMPMARPGVRPSTDSVMPISSVTEGSKCQVCLAEFSSAEPGAVKCPHCGSQFHYRCITKWVNKHGTCPICKKEIHV